MNPTAIEQQLPTNNQHRRLILRVVIILLSMAMVPAMTGCKGKKKRAAEEQARLEALAAAERESYLTGIRDQLNDIINYTAGDLRELAEKEQELEDLINLETWEESDILVQIRRAQFHLKQERDRLTTVNQPSEPSVTPAQTMALEQVSRALSGIANAGNAAEANRRISRSLDMFASPDVPVLIIISAAGDYDRPTTVLRYLNYLKDQQRTPHSVHSVALDSDGKISEIELIKTQLRP